MVGLAHHNVYSALLNCMSNALATQERVANDISRWSCDANRHAWPGLSLSLATWPTRLLCLVYESLTLLATAALRVTFLDVAANRALACRGPVAGHSSSARSRHVLRRRSLGRRPPGATHATVMSQLKGLLELTTILDYHTRQISPFKYAPSGKVRATGWSGPCVILPMI